MIISNFLEKLNSAPESVTFADTMATIESNYDFTETTFKNGETNNEAGTNSGSCKLFAFAKLNGLDQEQTLTCFGVTTEKTFLKTLKEQTTLIFGISSNPAGAEFASRPKLSKRNRQVSHINSDR